MRNYWLFVLACLLTSPCWSWAQSDVFIVRDKDNGVVFTDRPESVENGQQQSVERVELQQPNIAQPLEVRPQPAQQNNTQRQEAVAAPTVTITAPADESTIAMGPGNFSVSVTTTPGLARGERLLLFIDGSLHGAPQESPTWYVEGALRGAHDLVVQRATNRGDIIAVSSPIRVYVLRPSIIRR